MVESFKIVRSEHMAAEGDSVAETGTYYIVDSLAVPLPPKMFKERGEREMLKVLSAFQVHTLKKLDSDNFLLTVNNITTEDSRNVLRPLKHAKASAWTEHPPSDKLVGVLQLGVSECNPGLTQF
jgi:hypothetical protein